MVTQENSRGIVGRITDFFKRQAIPKETQQQDRIASNATQNPSGPISTQPPVIDFAPPNASTQLPATQVGQWMSPAQPMAPTGQPFLAGRAYDYRLATNTQPKPRAFDAVSFDDLKTLANNSELVRLAIETRKAQMMQLTWNIVMRDPNENTDPNDSRIKNIEALMRYPDGVHPFPTWLAMLVDQMLTHDAPTLFPHRNLDGSLHRLMIVDGATIKRIIDLWGRTPLPTPDLPNPPAYQQIIKGVAMVNFTQEELIYWPYNPRVDHLYGLSPTEQVLVTANMVMRRQSLQLTYFTQGSVPDLIISVPASWTPAQHAEFSNMWHEQLSGDDAARREAKFVPDGMTIHQLKENALKNEFDEWLARIVCFAFSLPPTAFVKQQNRSNSEQQQESAEAEGMEPLMIWFKGLMDYIIEKYFGYDDLVFQWQEDLPQDPLELAQANKIYIESGVKKVNEVRQELGLDTVEGGDVNLLVSGATVIALDQLGDQMDAQLAGMQAAAQGQQQQNDNPPNDPNKKDNSHMQQRDVEQKKTISLDDIDDLLKKRVAEIKPAPIKIAEPQPITLNLTIENKPIKKSGVVKRNADGTASIIMTEE